jgi:hypothetical protein
MLWDFDHSVIRSMYSPLRPIVDLELLGVRSLNPLGSWWNTEDHRFSLYAAEPPGIYISTVDAIKPILVPKLWMRSPWLYRAVHHETCMTADRSLCDLCCTWIYLHNSAKSKQTVTLLGVMIISPRFLRSVSRNLARSVKVIGL